MTFSHFQYSSVEFLKVVKLDIEIVKTPTPTQPNTTCWFDTKITVQTTPPTHPPPTETFQPLLDQLES